LLLSLSICSVESVQAFLFYLTQYTISNLNAFIILIVIGFSLNFYNNSNKEHEELKDKKNSPVQLIDQLKGYFYVNPLLALSLCITIFSFAGIPPLVGFFGKQMVLSAALDKGYIFLSLVAIITSVIGACYYLNIIKEMFFFKSDYKFNIEKINILNLNDNYTNFYSSTNIAISSYISLTISTITIIILLFIVDSQI
jgi:NADH-ubiquinone oxidoreductase chain 2